jgi:hypothetical protein
MPDCHFYLENTVSTINKGQQFVVQIHPDLRPGCSIDAVAINKIQVQPGDGDRGRNLKAIGWGSNGQLTFEALKDEPSFEICVCITCEDCNPPTRLAWLTVGDFGAKKLKTDLDRIFDAIGLIHNH